MTVRKVSLYIPKYCNSTNYLHIFTKYPIWSINSTNLVSTRSNLTELHWFKVAISRKHSDFFENFIGTVARTNKIETLSIIVTLGRNPCYKTLKPQKFWMYQHKQFGVMSSLNNYSIRFFIKTWILTVGNVSLYKPKYCNSTNYLHIFAKYLM